MISALADLLRADLRNRLATLTAEQRIHLALRLGEDDLELFMAASGIAPAAALRRLAATRAVGRRPSRAALPAR